MPHLGSTALCKENCPTLSRSPFVPSTWKDVWGGRQDTSWRYIFCWLSACELWFCGSRLFLSIMCHLKQICVSLLLTFRLIWPLTRLLPCSREHCSNRPWPTSLTCRKLLLVVAKLLSYFITLREWAELEQPQWLGHAHQTQIPHPEVRSNWNRSVKQIFILLFNFCSLKKKLIKVICELELMDHESKTWSVMYVLPSFTYTISFWLLSNARTSLQY